MFDKVLPILQELFSDAIATKIPSNAKSRKIAWYVVIVSAVALFASAVYLSRKAGTKDQEGTEESGTE